MYQSVNTSSNIFTVTKLNRLARSILESEIGMIWLTAEISNFVSASSGHWYFSLKDEKAQIKGLMFKGFNSRVKFEPENGMEVLIKGKITVYEPRGDYNLYAEHMEPVGAGALQKAFEQLKAKLSKEGLFSEDKKQDIPAFPKQIGVVTSPTGAAIQPFNRNPQPTTDPQNPQPKNQKNRRLCANVTR